MKEKEHPQMPSWWHHIGEVAALHGRGRPDGKKSIRVASLEDLKIKNTKDPKSQIVKDFSS